MKPNLVREAKKMAAIFAYLVVILGGFATYTRLALHEHGISYVHYGCAVVESLVLAKVILIGDLMRLGERFRGGPLIIPTFHKTFSFSVLVLVFFVAEHLVGGLFDGKGLSRAFGEIISENAGEILAKVIVLFATFIPLFAIRELGRVVGEGKLLELFFRRRADAAPGDKEIE
jgi:hypothetical protein